MFLANWRNNGVKRVRKWRSKRDFLKLLQYREKSGDPCQFVKQHSQFTDGLLQRLGLEFELEGHQGCVNCLQWTPDGRFLASGSDDTNVILWDPFRHKQLQVIPTSHIGNIFSVKFLGNNSKIIATAAGDCRILVQSIDGTADKNSPLMECGCHVNRVKRLATSPDEPSLFWSAGEDGYVLQFDLREQHICSSSNAKVFVDLSKVSVSEIKCVAVNPTKPHYVAVGVNDCYVRMYDRRMIKPSIINRSSHNDSPDPSDGSVQYYAPGHLAVENATTTNFRLAVTYISFNAAGSEMLVNMGGEQIYLFDVNNNRHVNELRVPTFGNGKRKSTAYKCWCHPEANGYFNGKKGEFHTETCPCYYTRRAYKSLRRNWMGDLYASARDHMYVIQNWPEQIQAYINLIKCMIALKWIDEAQTWIKHLCSLHPELTDSHQIQVFNEKLEDLRTSPKDNEMKDFMKKIEETETQRRLDSMDYETRFLGHCNTTTDIKEANFLGEDANYICAGSDEGNIFIWERKNSTIVTALSGDISIVNCIQPHPSSCFIASSGIDPVVKLWSPMQEDGSKNPRLVKEINKVVEANQQRMSMDPFESMLVNMGYRIQEVNEDDAPTCRTC